MLSAQTWPHLKMLVTPMAERMDVMYIFVSQKILLAFYATAQLSVRDSATAFIFVYIVLTLCLLIGYQLTVNFGNQCNLQIL